MESFLIVVVGTVFTFLCIFGDVIWDGIKVTIKGEPPTPVNWALVERLSKENDFYLPNFYIWKDVFDPPKDPQPKKSEPIVPPLYYNPKEMKWQLVTEQCAEWLSTEYPQLIFKRDSAGYVRVGIPPNYNSISDYMVRIHS